MSKKTKALLYNLICFAFIFVALRFVLDTYTQLSGLWLPITAFVIGTILAPKFQAIKTREGDKIFMKWLFLKGIKEV
ncbi:MAG: hypothetical protein KAX93_02345 [Flavobacterium sp.]|nr:hypothetical protein [Flavobacterium sp.]MBP8157195.1 hypothetical protein [Flavobacterium sp.]